MSFPSGSCPQPPPGRTRLVGDRTSPEFDRRGSAGTPQLPRRSVMTSLDTATTTLNTEQPPGRTFDEEQMAAASFLARYSGRTLEAYRDDLRGFFQWAHDHHVEVMRATRPHIELFRVSMEHAGWPRRPSIVDSRRSAASTSSGTSTGSSRPTRPSTSDDPRSIRPRHAVSTAPTSHPVGDPAPSYVGAPTGAR